MEVEEIFKRSKATAFTDFDDTFGGVVTTWIVSHSKERPINKEEAYRIVQKMRNAGLKERIVFLPQPCI